MRCVDESAESKSASKLIELDPLRTWEMGRTLLAKFNDDVYNEVLFTYAGSFNLVRKACHPFNL